MILNGLYRECCRENHKPTYKSAIVRWVEINMHGHGYEKYTHQCARRRRGTLKGGPNCKPAQQDINNLILSVISIPEVSVLG
jgi:hypothetical protein